MKNLNIKSLAKGMRVEDRAKLMFASRNRMAETNGKERLLTPDEEQAIINDARTLNQIPELNRLNKLYNVSTYILLDVQTAYLHFKIAEQKLVTVITGMILTGELNDVIDPLIYELASKGYTEEQLNKKETQNKVDKKANKIRKRYITRSLSNMYDYVEPSHRDKGYFSTSSDSNSEPNLFLQQLFMQVIDKVKKFKSQVYNYKYIESKAGIELWGDRERQMVREFKSEIDTFVKLEDFYSIIKVYPELANKKLVRTTDLKEPKFLVALADMDKATRLTKRHKRNLETELDNML